MKITIANRTEATKHPIGWISRIDLARRYGISPQTVSDRAKRLGLEFESWLGRPFATSEQVRLLDALNDHIKTGKKIKSFSNKSLPMPLGSCTPADLAKRYGMSVGGLYHRLCNLGLKSKKGYLTKEQIRLLDRLHKKLQKRHGIIKSLDELPLLPVDWISKADLGKRYGMSPEVVVRHGKSLGLKFMRWNQRCYATSEQVRLLDALINR